MLECRGSIAALKYHLSTHTAQAITLVNPFDAFVRMKGLRLDWNVFHLSPSCILGCVQHQHNITSVPVNLPTLFIVAGICTYVLFLQVSRFRNQEHGNFGN